VRANIEAWHSDQKAAIGEGFAIYPTHNLHMLLYAASYDGQGSIAMRAAKDYTSLTSDTSFEVLTLVRFGRFDEVIGVTNRPRGEIQGGLWDFAQGYAHLRKGDADFARVYLERVKRTAASSTAMVRVHAAKDLLGIVAGILEGEIARAEGSLDMAISAFERAALMQEALTYDEPEPLPFHAFHWLGAALLEARRYEAAEAAYRRELRDHPHNGWSLLGLQQSLRGQGKPTADVDADLKASWSRADTWTRASRF
jgi:tetratricopeptide (TPR) repeat protein